MYKRDGGFVIQRHPKVPQIGGLGAIIAYQANLCRLMRSDIGGGEELIKEASERGIPSTSLLPSLVVVSYPLTKVSRKEKCNGNDSNRMGYSYNESSRVYEGFTSL